MLSAYWLRAKTYRLRAAWATDAPKNDSVLIQTLRDYAKVVGGVAAACLKALVGIYGAFVEPSR